MDTVTPPDASVPASTPAPPLNIDPAKVRTIGVLKFRNIGDVLITTPALRVLRENFPNARITVLVNGYTAAMVKGNPDIDEVISYESMRGSGGLGRAWHELSFLWSIFRKFDLTIDFTSGDRAVWYSLLGGRRYRLGQRYYKWKGNNWRPRVFTHLYQMKDSGHSGGFGADLHEVEKHLWLLEQAGIRSKSNDTSLCITTTPEEKAWASNLLKPLRDGSASTPATAAPVSVSPTASEGAGAASLAPLRVRRDVTPIVVVHAVSRWLWKCWDDAAMADVIDWLQEERGARVVFTTSDDPREMDKSFAILGMCRTSPLFVPGNASLKQFAALCQQADVFFGVDTAPMHIAAAAGIPVVALFGPTNSHHWGPWTKTRTILREDCPCIANQREVCNWSATRACLAAITPERAKAALDEWLPAPRRR
ncbi:MAG: glycosyltransferase family 9 protein [Candidatus Methylacidiphilales bacterium]|nr:glycosyltransferase family 9 protein [Candidatus Methylacidiphilales bacterium]